MSKRIDSDDEKRGDDLRELRLLVPDARSLHVRRRVADASARLSPASEQDALSWIEAVSEFDSEAVIQSGEPRPFKRGIVTVAASGDYWKPRPAVIAQSDAFPGDSCVGHHLPDDVDAGRCG